MGKKNTAMMKWDEKLAEQAKIAAGMEAGVGTGESFSIKGGVLSFNGSPVQDNQMGVVILDHILANANYPDRYNPNSPSGPNCFAFGRSEADMMPHQVAVDAGTAQSAACGSCPLNEWGSADTGRGKACGNGRRLALISAGEFNKDGSFKMERDPEHYKSAGIGYLKLPATSIKPWAAFVKSVAATLGRPPHGIVTRIRVEADADDQVKVVCEPLEKLPDSVMAVIMERHEEAKQLIEFPFAPYEGPAKAAPRKAKAAPRQAPRPAPKAVKAPQRPAPKSAPRQAAKPVKPAPRQAPRAAAPLSRPQRSTKF